MVTANASAAAMSDEVISSIRNTVAFNTQEKLAKQYEKLLTSAEKSGFRLGIAISFLLATCIAIVELTYVRNS
jgi:ATP-binding cassette subfamily B (MDR/TAP) protein 1